MSHESRPLPTFLLVQRLVAQIRPKNDERQTIIRRRQQIHTEASGDERSGQAERARVARPRSQTRALRDRRAEQVQHDRRARARKDALGRVRRCRGRVPGHVSRARASLSASAQTSESVRVRGVDVERRER